MATTEIPVNFDESEIMDKLESGIKKYQIEALTEITAAKEHAASYAGYAGAVAAMISDHDDDVVMAACEALGAMGEYGVPYMDELVARFSSNNAKVKCAAIGSLGELGVNAAKCVGAVEKLLSDTNHKVKAAACIALGNMKASNKASELKKLLSNDHADVVSGAITGLAGMEDEGKKFASEVAKKLKAADKDIKISAVMYFTKHDDFAQEHSSDICGLLKDADLDVRHAVVAFLTQLGSKAESMISDITDYLTDSNPGVKAASALAIGAIGPLANSQADNVAKLLDDPSEDKDVLPLWSAGVERKPPAEFRLPASAAAIALSQMKAESFATNICELLSHQNADVRVSAATALGDLGAKTEDKLTQHLKDSAPQVKVAILKAIAKLAKESAQSESIKSKVEQMLDVRENPRVKAAALEALMNMGEVAADLTDTFKKMFEDRSIIVREAAIRAMGGVGPRGQCYAPDVCRQIYNGPAQVQIAAMETLAEMGERGSAFADEVAENVEHQDASVRIATIESLSKMGDAAAPFMSSIEHLRNDPVEAVRDAAIKVAMQTAAIGE